MEKSVILIRTSTKEQSPELQLDECKKFNDSKGWILSKVFSKQESAYKNEEGVWKDEIEWAINNDIRHIVVWNMDRFSRLEEEKVLDLVKMLSVMHNIKLHAVNGDAWSEIAEVIGKLNDMGFVGKALSDFLETMIRGIEFRRANRESKTKSERVKLAVRKVDGSKTKSYKGNNWGRKSLPKSVVDKIKKLRDNGMSLREISNTVYYYDKNGNKKLVSKSAVHKSIR